MATGNIVGLQVIFIPAKIHNAFLLAKDCHKWQIFLILLLPLCSDLWEVLATKWLIFLQCSLSNFQEKAFIYTLCGGGVVVVTMTLLQTFETKQLGLQEHAVFMLTLAAVGRFFYI